MSACERIGPLLDGYHDGELGVLRRWQVRRHLAGCGACREELTGLGGIGTWVRQAVDSTAPDPDVWRELRWRLPARPEPARSRRAGGVGRTFGIPAAALGAAATAVLALLVVGPPDPIGRTASTVVRSLNTHGRPVMVLEGSGDATIIWLMDEEGVQGTEEIASVWI
jgi:anti-sigma factor RsiW